MTSNKHIKISLQNHKAYNISQTTQTITTQITNNHTKYRIRISQTFKKHKNKQFTTQITTQITQN